MDGKKRIKRIGKRLFITTDIGHCGEKWSLIFWKVIAYKADEDTECEIEK